MATIKQGDIVITVPDHIELMERAGQLTAEEMARSPDKARRGVGFACKMTAAAMRKNPDKLTIEGVTPEQLDDYGTQADDIDEILVDLEVIKMKLAQNNFLLDARAHHKLREVLSIVRAKEKFDPRIVELVPDLEEYFSTKKRPLEPTK